MNEEKRRLDADAHKDLLLRQVEERRKDPEFMERLGRIMRDDAEVLDKLGVSERPDAIPGGRGARGGGGVMTYEEFVEKVENRPSTTSPLMFVATMHERPVQAGEWLLRWTREEAGA